MTEELYLKSKDLFEDIDYLKKVVKDHEENKHWIKIISSHYNSEFKGLSISTQRKLAEAIKTLIADLENEFEKLN